MLSLMLRKCWANIKEMLNNHEAFMGPVTKLKAAYDQLPANTGKFIQGVIVQAIVFVVSIFNIVLVLNVLGSIMGHKKRKEQELE